MNYGILGAGRLGTTLAKLLGDREEVFLWGRDKALIKRIQVERTNTLYMPGIELPYEIRATYDLEHVLNDSDVLVSAVPSRAFVEIIEKCMGKIHQLEAFICGTTGFAPQSGRRLSQEYLERVESLENYFTLVGPARPTEIVEEKPGNLVLAGKNNHNRDRLGEILNRNYLQVYGSGDLIGHEITASLNNLLALLGGLAEGLKMGSGTRASLLARGLHETREVVTHGGGEWKTVHSLTGLGGVISIGTSADSRNYRLGQSLAQGESLEQARSSIGGCLESINVAHNVHRRILRGKLRAPLLTELYGILHEELDPLNSIQKIINLKRPPGGSEPRNNGN